MNYERPVFSFFRFEDLRVYNKALEYVSWVYNASQLFPDSEKQGITARFISASQAIAINIAEGSTRNKSQFVYYLNLSKTSIRECVVLTTICQKLNFMTESNAEESKAFLVELTRMVGALISSLTHYERTAEKTEVEDDLPLPKEPLL